MKSWCKKLLTAGLIFMTAVAAVKTPMPVYADEVSGNSYSTSRMMIDGERPWS